jgi:hypothetical protein
MRTHLIHRPARDIIPPLGGARVSSYSASGGNDVLIGRSNYGRGVIDPFMNGDALTMSNAAQGGDDILMGGNSYGSGAVSNIMNGDAIS